MGGGDGLRLALRTSTIQQASLVYNHTTLGVVPLASERIRGRWQAVSVSYMPSGASVTLGETPLFTNVPLPGGLAPTARWRIAIGARCGDSYDYQMLDDMQFAQGASFAHGSAPVRLSANGRDFSPHAMRFEYYPPPIVLTVEPPCGPLDGGTSVTLRGFGLERPLASVVSGSSGYKCSWGACECELRTDCDCANVTQARYDRELGALVCTSPPWLGAMPVVSASSMSLSATVQVASSVRPPNAWRPQAPLRVALNGQDFTSTAHEFWR